MPQTLDGLHVLVVDDHPLVREAMADVMRYQGALVLVAGGATEALGILSALAVDVLVCDIQMPEHDGFWLIREAQTRELLTRIPCLALTGFGPEYREKILNAGFADHLVKPVDANDLCITVQALARGRPVPSAASDPTRSADQTNPTRPF